MIYLLFVLYMLTIITLLTININYFIMSQGHPFMESLAQNRALLFSLVGNSAVILLLACGFLPNLAVQFEIVDFPSHVSFVCVCVCVFNKQLSLLF